MAIKEVRVKTKSEVSIDDGIFGIYCFSEKNFNHEDTPSIFQADLLKTRKRVDNIDGKEGELLLSFEGGDNIDAEVNENGELIIKSGDNESEEYFRDGDSNENLAYNQKASVSDDNVLLEKGDVLLIKINPKIKGKLLINNYKDEVIGESDTNKVSRELRVSQDGVFWTDWNVFTTRGLDDKWFVTDNHLSIEIRYTKISDKSEGSLTFNFAAFNGIIQDIKMIAPTLQSSIFASVLGTDELSKLEINIFKKLYFRGIIPNYIIRADNKSYDEDKDFVDLFFSVSRFFSIFLSFFRRWEKFRYDLDLLREQVRGYGIYFNENDVSLEELQYLAENIFSQAQQRGTKRMFVRKGNKLPSGEVAKIDGEFVRLTRNQKSDELLVESIPTYKSGWCLGNSSPIYKGTAMSYNLNKTKENTKDFKSLSNFVITKSGGCNYSLISTDNKTALKLFARSGQVGLGRINEETEITENIYTADSQLDYEITFSFKIDNVSDKSSIELLFGVEGFDVNKNKLSDAFITPNGYKVSESFFNQKLNIWRLGQWYFARGIIHSYSTSNLAKNTTNLGIGNDLYFNNSFVKYIMPKIQIKSVNGASCTAYIWDYKIRPLVRGKNIIPLKDGTLDSFSTGFIQSSKILHTYVRNNNNGQSKDEIVDIIERHLYPYNTIDLFTIMSNY